MTVTAVDTVVADVMFVTELNWLLAFDPCASVPGRSMKLRSHVKRSDQHEDGAKDTQLRQRVRAVMENLWHRRSSQLHPDTVVN